MVTTRDSSGRAAVFLDRDGTLIEDRGHLQEPSEVVFFPETAGALRRLGERYELFLITNQRGIAEGRITMEECGRVNRHVVEMLLGAGVVIREVYVCPHRREEGCECIKPKPHFPRLAAAKYGLDLSRSYAVGDHPHDAELGVAMGGQGIYVLTGHGEKHRGELAIPCPVVADIRAATDWIFADSKIRRNSLVAKGLRPSAGGPGPRRSPKGLRYG